MTVNFIMFVLLQYNLTETAYQGTPKNLKNLVGNNTFPPKKIKFHEGKTFSTNIAIKGRVQVGLRGLQ